MAKRYLPHPAILIDPRKKRLRIFRCALHAIGDPGYVVLIVSPHNLSLCIARSDEADQRAYCLERALVDRNWSPEICSTSLVRDLFSMNEKWDQEKAYRVIGKANPNGVMAEFKFADAACFLGEQEWQ